MNIDLQWGGYYAVRGEGEEQFRVFRLLDFNRYSYHIAIYEETFARVPSLEEVVQLSPYVGHAPFDSRVLLREGEIHLLGGPPLAEADLQGYRLYLEHSEVEEKDIEELFGQYHRIWQRSPSGSDSHIEGRRIGGHGTVGRGAAERCHAHGRGFRCAPFPPVTATLATRSNGPNEPSTYNGRSLL